MDVQPDRRIGEVDRLRFAADFEQAAVIGFPHEAEQFRDLADLALDRRDPGQQRDPVRGDIVQPGLPRRRVVPDRVIGMPGQPTAQFRAPDRLVGCGGRPVIGMFPQIGRGEDRHRAVRCKPDLEPLRYDPRVGDFDIVRHLGQVEQALVVAGMPEGRALRVVAQPDGMEPRRGAILPSYRQHFRCMIDAGYGHAGPPWNLIGRYHRARRPSSGYVEKFI